jgi:hypothetical protein
MLRTLASQRNRAMVGMISRLQASRGSVLFSTNATEVFDDAANREQLEQVSQQMEDALQKEKQITQIPQVNGQTSNQMWDANSQGAKEPSDQRTSQANSPEMEQIHAEQQQINERQRIGDDLTRQANPMGFQTEAKSRDSYSHDKEYNANRNKLDTDNRDKFDTDNRNKFNVDNDRNSNNLSMPDPNKVMGQVKEMATSAAGLAAGAVNMAAGVGKVVQETAKTTMQNMKEMMPNAPSTPSSYNNSDEWRQERNTSSKTNKSGSLMEDTNKMIKETAKDLIDTMTHPSVDPPSKAEAQLQWHQQRAARAGEETQETSRGKQFSEHRQNASLL